jgi:4-hydroxybenzoate polyprenyltransferase
VIRAWVAHARPAMLPYLLLLVFGGYGFAHWDRALPARAPLGFALVLVAWTALHAGTLWLNAALDRDEGDVLWGTRAPLPPGLSGGGYAALALAAALSWLADRQAGVAGVGCAVLAVLYSHPRLAWKGHPIGGPVVNVVGYGLLTPYAGWAVADVPFTPRAAAVWAVGALAVAGAYFAAQAFQQDEDRARGYRTLVVTHGPWAAVTAARVCLGAAVFGALALAVIGYIPRVLLVPAAGAWWVDRYLAAWAGDAAGGDATRARGLASRVLGLGLLALALAFADHLRADFAGEPVAGLGTAAGFPADRPQLPPALMRAWEASHPLPYD